MPFWGGDRLVTTGAAQSIVAPFDPNQVDCSAYTLRMGAEAYVTPGMGDDLKQNLKISLSLPQSKIVNGKTILYGGGTVVIPPGQFAYLLTEESVHIPDNVMGFISLKSGIKFRGLINVSGFHVDPGFSGNLIYSVFNAGPSPIHLARGDNLFLLWLADLSGTVNPVYVKSGTSQVEIPSGLISQIAKENHSLQALSEKVDSLTSKVTIITAVSGGLTAAAALVLAFMALLPSDIPPKPETINVFPPTVSTPESEAGLPSGPQATGAGNSASPTNATGG